jgi:threonine dehydratase
MTTLPTLTEIAAARERLAPHLPVTPVSHALSLSETLLKEIYIKWDNKLRTGSFKERGALNFLLSLDPAVRARGVCTASAGNHALGVSYHAQRLGIPCDIIVPHNAPLVKVERCKKYGARISYQASLAEAMEHAQTMAREQNLTYVPPFDHINIVHGHGVAALELMEQIPDFDSIIIPIGGGGYAAGIASTIKAKRPDVFVMGVISEWAERIRQNPELYKKASFAPMTIADGIAVKQIGKVTGPILDQCVDKIVAASESSIAHAIIALLEQERAVVEGAGAAGVAALMDGHLPDRCKKPVVFVCGSNIDMNLLSRLIEQDMGERGRLLRVNISLPDKPGMLHQISGIIAAQGANVLQVLHDRFYARLPGYVDMTVVMEVRDRAHGKQVIQHLNDAGLPTQQV